MDISLEKQELEIILNGIEALNRTGIPLGQSAQLIQLANKLSSNLMNSAPKITPVKPKDDGK